jgi:hypothetical protein
LGKGSPTLNPVEEGLAIASPRDIAIVAKARRKSSCMGTSFVWSSSFSLLSVLYNQEPNIQNTFLSKANFGPTLGRGAPFVRVFGSEVE